VEESYESVDQGRQVDSEHESEVDGVALRLVSQPNEVRFVAGGEVSACKSRRKGEGDIRVNKIWHRSVRTLLLFSCNIKAHEFHVQPASAALAPPHSASFGLRRLSM
jgi:hypothetical protein